MRNFIPLLPLSVLLVSCGGSTGTTGSSRTPAGNPDAAVTVVEYADLQCPACKNAHTGVAKPIIEKYGNQIRYEFKHFPLRSIHRFALDAAEAAECAADQGKFWEYIDLAFEKQSDLSFDALLTWAEELELDVGMFEQCWKSHSKKSIVLADYGDGRDLDVNGTPSFFVDGVRVQTGYDTVSAAIEAAVEGAAMRL